MEKYVILADVTCDLSEEIRRYCGMTDYIRGHIHFSDGRDFATTLDWSKIERSELYSALSGKKLDINTAPASPEEYFRIFKDYADKGYKILSMSISSKISSTFNAAQMAAERLKSECPGCDAYAFDSFRMSGAFGLLVMHAHLLKQEGKTFEEVIAWLEENKYKVHQMGPIDDLMYIARRGRISMGKAIMGSFAGVKPMGDCSNEGYVSVLTKVKGISRSFDITARYVKETATDISSQPIIIAHSNRQEYAETLADILLKTVQPKKLFITDVFSGSGANVGPGMIGVYYLGDTVSEDQVKEKEIMNKILTSSK